MTKRNTDILTDKELFEKMSRMVEHIVNGKIKLLYNKGDNYCNFLGEEKKTLKNLYRVNIATPQVKGIPKYTALVHELAHIIYKTPFSAVHSILFDSHNEDDYGRSPWILRDNKVEIKFKNKKLAHTVWNVLEDQRIESHLAKYYIDYKNRFDKCKKGIGNDMEIPVGIWKDNPAFTLMAIRFFREDLAKRGKYYAECKKYIEYVEETDEYGALRALLALRDIINKWSDRMDEFGGQEQRAGMPPMIRDKLSKVNQEKHLHQQIKSVPFEAPFGTSKMELFPRDIERHLTGKEDVDLEGILQNGKILGDKLSQDVRSSMLESDGIIDKTPASVVMIRRKALSKPEPNKRIASRLKRVFEKVKMKRKPHIDNEGEDTDTEEFIKRKIDGVGLNRCKVNVKETNGASIILSVDASTSMRGSISAVRDVVATLYDSVKTLKNVEIRGNVWSSNGVGQIGMTEVNSVSELKNIEIAEGYFATPTHMAFEYSTKQMKEMRGNKRLTFVITDGAPNYSRNHKRYPRNAYKDVCIKKLSRLKAVSPNVVCIMMGRYDPWSLKEVQQTFGKTNVIAIRGTEGLSEKVIKQFKEVVMNTI